MIEDFWLSEVQRLITFQLLNSHDIHQNGQFSSFHERVLKLTLKFQTVDPNENSRRIKGTNCLKKDL